MTPKELESVAKAIGAMFQCFPQSVLADPDLQVRGYIAAVKNMEAVDVLAACQRFIQGDVPEHNRAFCPSSAQLCHEARQRKQMREIMAARQSKLEIVGGRDA